MFVTGHVLAVGGSARRAGRGGRPHRRRGRFRNKNLNLVSFLVFSLNPMGSYLMLWIDPSGYTSYLAGKGTEQAYLDTMVSTGAGWVLPGMIALTLVCALVSALVGRRLLKKQFEKAGVTA